MLPPYAIYYYISWFPVVLLPNCVPTAFTNPRYLYSSSIPSPLVAFTKAPGYGFD